MAGFILASSDTITKIENQITSQKKRLLEAQTKYREAKRDNNFSAVRKAEIMSASIKNEIKKLEAQLADVKRQLGAVNGRVRDALGRFA